jgi:DNA repair protein RadC
MKCTIGNSNDTCEYFDNPKIGYVVPKKLFGKDSNAKTKKGIPLGYSTYLIYLAPAKQNKFGKNLCSGATQGCMASCLFSAGRGRMKPVEKARKNKAEYFLSDRDAFMTQVYREIETAYKSSLKNGIPIAVRMNGTSDVPWENILVTSPSGKRYTNIMAAFPKVQFYDYTKIYRRLGNTPKNYHLSFSRGETAKNKLEAEQALKRKFQVSVVFNIKKGQPFPKKWNGYEVVDGDEHDLTFLRKKGVVLGLRAKGDAKKDETGFVIRGTNYNRINGYPIQKEIVVGSIGAAETLKDLVPEVKVSVVRKSNKIDKPIGSAVDAVAKFRQYIDKNKIQTQEFFAVMYAKTNYEVIGIYNHTAGGVNATIADVRLILAGALNLMASAIVLCHNHPSGNLRPSDADIKITKSIKEAAKIHDIAVVDHIILTKNGFYSFAEQGLM